MRERFSIPAALVALVLGCSTDPTFVADSATASAAAGGGTGATASGNGGASTTSTSAGGTGGAGGGMGGTGQGGAAGSGGSGGACDQKDSLDVFCIAPGGMHLAQAALSYGQGFPPGLPAMGLGQPALGYIQATVPFTCVAQAGAYGVATNNTGGGKICEVIFENDVPGPVTGTGAYTLTADPSAMPGDYLFAFTANSGTTVLSPNFYMRVQ